VLPAAAYAVLKEFPEHAPLECTNYKTKNLAICSLEQMSPISFIPVSKTLTNARDILRFH
jgi:hypothetical protein